MIPWITLATFLPWLGALVVALAARRAPVPARKLALAWSLLPLVIVGGAMAAGAFRIEQSDALQMTERAPWIPALGVEYFVGLDGLGLVCLLLAALVVPLALAVGGAGGPLGAALFLFLQGSLVGTFTALNFVHWFVFWELSLVPAFFLIKLWGGPRRSPAAYQFFVYTMLGSAAMLVAMVAVYRATGTFDFVKLAEHGRMGLLDQKLGGPSSLWPTLVFFGVLLGLAVKVPLFPFHTWLPEAYGEAPAPATMVLTGVMSKMGLYGFLRLLGPVFPEQMKEWSPLLIWLAVAGIVFSAWAALAQRDMKRMFAYSSINHLGYCLLAVFAVGSQTGTSQGQAIALDGCLLQIFNHGLTAPVLFACVALLERRSGGRAGLDDFGGLRARVPVFAGFFGIALFSSLGLPALNGFIGEFLVFQGGFMLQPAATAVATVGLLLTAVFLLTFWKKVFHGPPNERWSSMPDLSRQERLLLAPALLLMIVLGLFPQLLLHWLNPVAQALLPGLR